MSSNSESEQKSSTPVDSASNEDGSVRATDGERAHDSKKSNGSDTSHDTTPSSSSPSSASPDEHNTAATDHEIVINSAIALTQELMGIISDSVTKGDDRMAVFFTLPLLKQLGELDSLIDKIPSCHRRQVVESEPFSKHLLDVLIDAAFHIDNKNPVPDNLNKLGILCLLYAVYSTITDCSELCCHILMDRGIVALLIKNISDDDYREHMDSDDLSGYFCSVNLCSIHNIAKIPESQAKFDEVNAVQAIQYFCASKSEKIQISALSCIACILDESSVSKTCLDHFQIIPKLVKCLQKSIEAAPFHSYMGFSAEELVESLSFLAVCDRNKQSISSSGAIPLLVTMLTSCSKLEQIRACDCLWTLAFDDEIRQKIIATENSLVYLEKVYQAATDPVARTKARRALEYIKVGATGLQEIVAERRASVSAEKEESSSGHIFISYSWKHQDTILKINDALEAKGFKVWLDVHQMHGSTLEAMAKAVENACLVLMCYSENYKQSNNCRAEAEYIFNLKKPFIPLNMQYRYQPIGWLGIIIGAKLYFDFSLEQQPFEVTMSKLLTEIVSLKRQYSNTNKDDDVVDVGPNRPSAHISQAVEMVTHQQQVYQSTAKSDCLQQISIGHLPHSICHTTHGIKFENDKVKAWNVDMVQEWLVSENLAHLSNLLKRFDGRSLVGLFQMKVAAPNVYYKQLLKMLDDSLVDSLQLSTALETLFTSPNSDIINRSSPAPE